MLRRSVFTAIVFLLLFFGASTVQAAINQQINYQGKLTNASDVAVADGDYSIAFALYTAASGGLNPWSETQTVTVTNGLFSVMLGSVSSLAAVNFNQTLYLGVNVAADGEMTPRKVIGAVPAAFEADKLDGLDSISFARTDTTSTFSSGFLSTASSTITNLTMVNSTSTSATTTNQAITGLAAAAGTILAVDSTGRVIATTTPAGAVASVSNADGTLSIPVTIGTVVASLNLTNPNIWTGLQQFARASTTLFSSYGPAYFGATATSSFDTAGNLNLASAAAYSIAGASVLNATTLGAGVTTASGLTTASLLVTVGALNGGTITTDFGTINNADPITGTVLNGTTGINTGAGAGTQRINSSGALLNITTITASGGLTLGSINGGDISIDVVDSTTADTPGGSLTLSAGNGANVDTDGGSVKIDPGAKAGAGANGNILLGSIVLGNVGIGTTTPWGRLTLELDTQNAGLVVANQGSSTPAFYIGGVNQNGHIGFGTASPNEQLEITGNLRLPATTATAGIIRSGTDSLLHTYGTQNTFTGVGAGNFSLTGIQNSGIGYLSLSALTGGSSNVAIGSGALQSNTSGSSNVAIGTSALASNAIGSNNIAIGVGALTNNQTSNNLAIGNDALSQNTTGYYNVALGDSSLGTNTIGNFNVAVGRLSLSVSTTGASSTAVGYEALLNNTTGASSTALGFRSGLTNTTGSKLTLIGAGADVISNNLSNAAAIGHNAKVGASDSLVLGGTGADQVKVGIGTTSPWRTFSVDGTVSFKNLTSSDLATTDALCVDANNDVVRDTSDTCVTSSKRFKHDIVNIDGSLGTILSLNPVSFIYNDQNKRRFGLIAEEVSDIEPLLVHLDVKGKPRTVYYEGVTALLVESVQELNLKVETLSSRVETRLAQSPSLAPNFPDNFFEKILNWLADAGNGLKDLFADTFRAKEKICVGETCVDEADLKRILKRSGIQIEPEEPDEDGRGGGGDNGGGSKNDNEIESVEPVEPAPLVSQPRAPEPLPEAIIEPESILPSGLKSEMIQSEPAGEIIN
ncbi:MAG: tail fiber domain-containing protein [Patescibacteria group bacterium]